MLTCFLTRLAMNCFRTNKPVGSLEFDEGWDEDGDVGGTDKMADSYWARRAVASQGGGVVVGGKGGGSVYVCSRPLHPT